jgi:hypothetical protein
LRCSTPLRPPLTPARRAWIPKKDLVGVFLVQQPDVSTERSAFMAMAASAIAE